MIYIKEYLNVQRNIKPFNSDVLEDFDFNFEYDDENAMFTENWVHELFHTLIEYLY